MADIHFGKVTIIGVGLIGASLAMAMRKASVAEKIVGGGRSEENLRRARQRGIIDSYSTSLEDAVDSSELVVLASPVGTFREIIKKIGDRLKEGTVVTDVGSVKGSLVAELETMLPEGRFFVGAHPIAGSDRSGLDYAHSELFRNSVTIITPTENTDPDATERVVSLWKAIGARVVLMSPSEHDRVLALTSHLPHVVSYALVNTVEGINSRYIEYTGGGFRDTTRIASSSPELWTDILLSNRDNVLEMMEIFRERLDEIETALRDKDAAALLALLERAKKLREEIN